MVAGREVPHVVVLCVGLDDGEVRGDVKPPSGGPSLQFGSQFRPLLLDPADVPALVMEEQSCGLDEALDEQDLILRGDSPFEVVPQVLPRLVSVPEFGLVKQRGARFQQRPFFWCEWTGDVRHQALECAIGFECLSVGIVLGRRCFIACKIADDGERTPHPSRGGLAKPSSEGAVAWSQLNTATSSNSAEVALMSSVFWFETLPFTNNQAPSAFVPQAAPMTA